MIFKAVRLTCISLIAFTVLIALIASTPAEAAAAGCENTSLQDSFDRNVNVLVIWTDEPNLKALNLLKIDVSKKRMDVVCIPVNKTVFAKKFIPSKYLVKNSGAGLGGIARLGSITELNSIEEIPEYTIKVSPKTVFSYERREGLVAEVEELFGEGVDFYVQVDQPAFERASDIIGPFPLNGRQTTMAESFEDTSENFKIGYEKIIRALAVKLRDPAVIVQIPRLAWMFIFDVETNLGLKEILNLYRLVDNFGPENIYRSIFGKTYFAPPASPASPTHIRTGQVS